MMSVDRLKQFLGLDECSRRGKKALGIVAENLAPDPITGNRQRPIEGILLPPFSHLRFTATGIGRITDEAGFCAGFTDHPFVAIVNSTGYEWTYQKTRWGVVRRFPGDEPTNPLTLQDALILENAASLTATLKRNEVLW